MDRELTLEEKATNAETWKHIFLVQKLLAKMQVELMKRQFTHDQSKLRSPEVEAFTEVTHKLKELTYGSPEYQENLREIKSALKHHYSANRHHPEFFENGIEDMNLIDVIELLCDWYAASKRHNDGDIHKSIKISVERFGLSPQLVAIINNTIPLMEDMFEGLHTQADI